MNTVQEQSTQQSEQGQKQYQPQEGDVTHLMTLRVYKRMREERFLLGTTKDVSVRFRVSPEEAVTVIAEMTRYGWVTPRETGREAHKPAGPGIRSIGPLPRIPGAFVLTPA